MTVATGSLKDTIRPGQPVSPSNIVIFSSAEASRSSLPDDGSAAFIQCDTLIKTGLVILNRFMISFNSFTSSS